jgi:hypothetical protein
MPILDLQMRMRQLGEIRIGHVVSGTTRDGKAYTRPAKLDKFRFTSPSREILAEVARLYGGEVQPWTPANGGPSEFEVYSTATRLPVVIPPRDAVSQWYELYAGSKCMRRCDGRTEMKSDKPCMCIPENRRCSITTRVNVMLRDLPALGQWLLISKGYNAAVTLPPAAELLAQAGGYVPGWLGLEEKSAIVDEKTTRFVVPTLDVEVTPLALMSGEVGQALESAKRAAVEQPARAAIEAPSVPNYASLARMARDVETVRDIHRSATKAGHMTSELERALTDRAAQITAKAAPAPSVPAPPLAAPGPDEPIEAEVVDDNDPSEVWGQIVFAAGSYGWTTKQLTEKYAEHNGGEMPGSDVAAMKRFLADVKAGLIR